MSDEIIRTAAELNALPATSIVRSPDGDIWERRQVSGAWTWDCLSEEGRSDPYSAAAILRNGATATVLYRPDRPAVVKPSRERLIEALMAPVHAPQGTHDPRDGACLQCPWPLHAAGSPEEIADAVLALLPGRPLREVLAQGWDEGYAQAVTDHLLIYDSSDDTPNPYRTDDRQEADR